MRHPTFPLLLHQQNLPRRNRVLSRRKKMVEISDSMPYCITVSVFPLLAWSSQEEWIGENPARTQEVPCHLRQFGRFKV
ncbi:hypothetical protein B0H17DRAFT_1088468 [Mycena rosella]|uniref:Uncharacterized protein n=1 Tax=Mycena rosella TaxID=1033263 RepID=A0AAD7D0J9_MYCRO|nr:hypothetical protein B0H17DRAFT_1088468 [Mycena rosella]